FLMFARLLDMTERRNEQKASLGGGDFKHLFGPDQQHLRWSHFKILGAADMLPLVRDRVFPHFRNAAVDGATFGEYMKDAQL
ncbi:DNA methyltransferase, partial [Acinetobacter baumannii]